MVTIRRADLDELRAELVAAGQDMAAIARRLLTAAYLERVDVVTHEAGRLSSLGRDYQIRGRGSA